jgi:uncharacterized protein YecT (DUF1311 family)
MRRTTTRAAVLALMTVGARAGEPPFTPAWDTCLEKAGGVTAAMVTCIDAETKVQDARLNDAYKAAMTKLKPAQVESTGCVMSMTAERAEELEALADR